MVFSRKSGARYFLKFVAVALFITVLGKVWSVFGDAGLAYEREPIFNVPFGALLITAAVCELCVATFCLLRPVVDGLLAVAWLSAVLWTYRIGLWYVGWQKPCNCLGNLTDALHISPQLADNIMKGLLAFMLIGSVSLLVAHYRKGQAGQKLPALQSVAEQ